MRCRWKALDCPLVIGYMKLLCIFMTLVGYGMGWSAPIILKLQDAEQTSLPVPITDGQASWVASVLYIGTIIGPHVSGYLSNKQGLMAGSQACTVSGRISLLWSFKLLFLYVFLESLVSTNIMLLTGTGIFSTFDVLVVFSAAPYISYAATSYNAMGISIAYIVCIFFIPETPEYHVLKSREKEAKDVLILLGRDEVTKVITSQTEKQTVVTDWKELFTIRENRKAFMSGFVVVTFFATTIFELAGSTIQPNIQITQLVSSIISSCFVEKVGRKVLLLWSTAACFVSLVGWLPLVCLVIFGCGLSSAFGYMISGISGHYTFWIFASACALTFSFYGFYSFFRNFVKLFYFCIQDLHKALLHILHTHSIIYNVSRG
ncbi:hypothetical protein ABMA28_009878 [Loxostege sticticalis]|uniref:Uncharacterized protein n=1 Tax=Loxostege sticticalis TaxID=481309 RepID=A0ABD0SDX7_LOXSC